MLKREDFDFSNNPRAVRKPRKGSGCRDEVYEFAFEDLIDDSGDHVSANCGFDKQEWRIYYVVANGKKVLDSTAIPIP
jgi:hypothetical protein